MHANQHVPANPLSVGANGLKHFLQDTGSVAPPQLVLLRLQWLCMLCQVAQMQASGMHALQEFLVA